MFEGKPLRPNRPVSLGEEEAEDLRPLEWAELASRLAATRDLRCSLRPTEPGGDASFDALSARRIAAHRDGMDPVNPEDSANGKDARASDGGASPAGRRDPARNR